MTEDPNSNELYTQQCCKLRKREIDSFGHSINGVHANPTSCFIFPIFLLSNVTTMEGKKREDKKGQTWTWCHRHGLKSWGWSKCEGSKCTAAITGSTFHPHGMSYPFQSSSQLKKKCIIKTRCVWMNIF